MTGFRALLGALAGELRASAGQASRLGRNAWARTRAALEPGTIERAELAHALALGLSHARQSAWSAAIALMLAGAAGAIAASPALVLGAVHAMWEARGDRRDEAADVRARLREAAAEMEGVAFIERFRALDSNRWVFSDGWSNGSFMENDWRSRAYSITPDGLAITLDWNEPGAGKIFSSGELQSRESFRYGYFEARMKVPAGEGLVTGLFTYTQPNGRSSWEEIDIEILGRDTRTMELTYHVHGRSRQTGIDLGFDASEDFHIYGFEWTENAVRWYVDGRMVHEVRGARVADLRRPQRLYLQLWNSAELYRWVGHINPQEAPWVLHVSCIAQAREYRGAPLCAPREPDTALRGR